MVAILSAVLGDGLEAVEAACSEAQAAKFASADVILTTLVRHKEPEPAADIATPAGLQLTHAPVADCARYDDLRRARHGAA